MATLPLVVGALTWALVHRWREPLGLGRLSARGTLLVGFALLSGLVVAISELSSVGHRFTTTTVAAAWTVLAVVLAAAAVASGAVDARRLGRAITVGWRTASMPERAALAVAAAYVALLAAAALLYRPRTADSMMYHLTRVEHWVQNRSVAPFATHMVAQVDMAPLHEYGLAHLHLLTGSDRFDGLIQLLAYAVVVVGASELTRLLGGARPAQVLAAMLALTLPSAVLEASSTQNDLMGAAAGLTLVTMIAAWDTRPGAPYLPRAVIIGLAGALAFLAKGTVLPTIGPTALALSVLWAFREVRTGGARTAVTRVGASAAIAVVAALLVAGPFAARNVALFGSVNGSDEAGLLIEDPTLAATAANVIRGVAGNFRIGNGSSGIEHALSAVALRAGQRAFDATGVEPDDSRYALGGDYDVFTRRDYRVYQRYAEHGANPWHVLLLIAAGATILVRSRHRGTDRSAVVVVLGLGAGLVLFYGLVRWQIFGVRFQLTMLAVGCALIALVLSRWGRATGAVVVGLLVVASTPMLLRNAERPLLQPTFDDADTYLEHYLPDDTAASASAADQDALAAALAESGCDRLGLANWIPFEYPMWIALDHHGWSGEIQAVGVANDTTEAADADFEPCALAGSAPVGPERPGYGEWRRFGGLDLALLDPDP